MIILIKNGQVEINQQTTANEIIYNGIKQNSAFVDNTILERFSYLLMENKNNLLNLASLKEVEIMMTKSSLIEDIMTEIILGGI